MKAPIYEASPKHLSIARGDVGAAPTNGQAALNNALQISPNSPRMVGVDPSTGEYVVFDETYPGKGIYHGHVREWSELTQEMRTILFQFGATDSRGRILAR
jgi:hypothetical protein